jgi:hypothetical protein
MFAWLKKKAAQQSLFNVEINTRTLILVANKTYPDEPASAPASEESYRAGTEKVNAQRSLLHDILLALENGASTDEVRARIEAAKTEEATLTHGAEMAIDVVLIEVAKAAIAHGY